MPPGQKFERLAQPHRVDIAEQVEVPLRAQLLAATAHSVEQPDPALRLRQRRRFLAPVRGRPNTLGVLLHRALRVRYQLPEGGGELGGKPLRGTCPEQIGVVLEEAAEGGALVNKQGSGVVD